MCTSIEWRRFWLCCVNIAWSMLSQKCRGLKTESYERNIQEKKATIGTCVSAQARRKRSNMKTTRSLNWCTKNRNFKRASEHLFYTAYIFLSLYINTSIHCNKRNACMKLSPPRKTRTQIKNKNILQKQSEE